MVLSSAHPLILEYLPEKQRQLWEENPELRRVTHRQEGHFLSLTTCLPQSGCCLWSISSQKACPNWL